MAHGEADGYGSQAVNEMQGARASYSADVTIPPVPQQTVTVVFNDGRTSEQIYNYLITPTTLTVLDHKYHEIPLDQINLAATQDTNRAEWNRLSRAPSVTLTRSPAWKIVKSQAQYPG